jgi:transcriptional regulator with XRE-family HTH domain
MSNEFAPKRVAARVRLLRKAKGVLMQKQMATLIGAEEKQYNHWENGRQIIPVQFALKICGLTGATLDYIYQGNTSALPLYLVSALKEIEPQEL